ncbi:MAG TPA: ankyrin repeat domain-containing protein [Candidatus Babeliales bacterium]|nr:ankyrin repeat domain-containing protein [Candidatus Babeliales bacterium]
MIHYLQGLGRYMEIFKNSKKSHIKKQSKEPKNITFLEKLQTMLQSSKKPIIDFKEKIKSFQDEEAKVNYALYDNFEDALITTLEELKNGSEYSTKIIRRRYGYQGQSTRPNCIEAALQDLCNNLLYDQNSGSFKLSLLPASLHINDMFKKFYETYSIDNLANTPDVGQAFMDLVSNITGVIYRDDKNYELKAESTENNLITLFNYFFGIDAQNLYDLGTMLSDDRRIITFQSSPDNTNNTNKIITVTIKNNQTKKEKNMNLCFKPMHGWLDCPDRDHRSLEHQSLLDLDLLSKKYNLSSEAQALFSVQPIKVSNFIRKYSGTMLASKMYSVEQKNDYDKIRTILSIVSLYPDNTELVDYAYSLYNQLSDSNKKISFKDIFESKVWYTHEKFKKIIVGDLKDLVDYISKDFNINIVSEIYSHLPDESSKQVFLAEILIEYGRNEKIINDDTIEQFYQLVTDDAGKKNFLIDSIVNVTLASRYDIDSLKLVKELVSIGGDVNSTSTKTGITPLIAAVMPKAHVSRGAQFHYGSLVELLIESGADVNKMVTINFTSGMSGNEQVAAIHYAALNDYASAVRLLAKYGVDLNMYCYRHYLDVDVRKTPLGFADNDSMLALLENGADPNMSSDIEVWKFSEKNIPEVAGKIVSYPLINAVRAHDVKKVKALLAYNADINVIDGNGKTVFDYLKESKGQLTSDQLPLIRSMLEKASGISHFMTPDQRNKE